MAAEEFVPRAMPRNTSQWAYQQQQQQQQQVSLICVFSFFLIKSGKSPWVSHWTMAEMTSIKGSFQLWQHAPKAGI